MLVSVTDINQSNTSFGSNEAPKVKRAENCNRKGRMEKLRDTLSNGVKLIEQKRRYS